LLIHFCSWCNTICRFQSKETRDKAGRARKVNVTKTHEDGQREFMLWDNIVAFRKLDVSFLLKKMDIKRFALSLNLHTSNHIAVGLVR
jgi:hypothetical protein